MELPADIRKLVYSYILLPRLVDWVRTSADIVNNPSYLNPYGYYKVVPEIFTLNKHAMNQILKFSFGVVRLEYAIDYKTLYNKYLYTMFMNLCKIKSKRFIDMANLMFKHFKNPDPRTICILLTNPEGYKFIKKSYPEILKTYLSDKTMHDILLQIKEIEIPELIELIEPLSHEELSDIYNKSRTRLILENPYMWKLCDPFTHHIKNIILGIEITDEERKNFLFDCVSNNTCEGAINLLIDIYAQSGKFSCAIFKNPGACRLIKQLIIDGKLTSVNADYLCLNTNPEIIGLLKQYPKYIKNNLSANSLDIAVDILLENKHLIHLDSLVSNTNPRIAYLLKANFPNFELKHLDTLLTNPLIYQVKLSHNYFKRINRLISKNKINHISTNS